MASALIERWNDWAKEIHCPELETLQAQWESRFNLIPDPRVLNWPLMDITHCLSLALGYLVVTYGGMMIMSKVKRPFEVYGLRVLHNFAMVALSVYMFYTLIAGHFKEKFAIAADPSSASMQGFPAPSTWSVWCIPFHKGEAGLDVAAAIWVFYISKPIEFMDTFIMVLRKSDRQINFLHVYHHFTIFLVWYINLRYNPGGDAWFAAAANSLVHIVMYSYYLLATLGIACPWKQYITQFQIFQFVSFVGQGLYGVCANCPSNPALLTFNCAYAFTLLALFIHFYRSSYRNRRTTTPVKKMN